ncbi:MAG: hypothetical protein VCB78_07015 [Myxococcota bacterium]
MRTLSRRLTRSLRRLVAAPLCAGLWLAAPVAAADEAPALASLVIESPRSLRLHEIQRALARDHERLIELLARPADAESAALRDDPELVAIAERMPQLQAEEARFHRDANPPSPPDVAAGPR